MTCFILQIYFYKIPSSWIFRLKTKIMSNFKSVESRRSEMCIFYLISEYKKAQRPHPHAQAANRLPWQTACQFLPPYLLLLFSVPQDRPNPRVSEAICDVQTRSVTSNIYNTPESDICFLRQHGASLLPLHTACLPTSCDCFYPSSLD